MRPPIPGRPATDPVRNRTNSPPAMQGAVPGRPDTPQGCTEPAPAVAAPGPLTVRPHPAGKGRRPRKIGPRNALAAPDAQATVRDRPDEATIPDAWLRHRSPPTDVPSAEKGRASRTPSRPIASAAPGDLNMIRDRCDRAPTATLTAPSPLADISPQPHPAGKGRKPRKTGTRTTIAVPDADEAKKPDAWLRHRGLPTDARSAEQERASKTPSRPIAFTPPGNLYTFRDRCDRALTVTHTARTPLAGISPRPRSAGKGRGPRKTGTRATIAFPDADEATMLDAWLHHRSSPTDARSAGQERASKPPSRPIVITPGNVNTFLDRDERAPKVTLAAPSPLADLSPRPRPTVKGRRPRKTGTSTPTFGVPYAGMVADDCAAEARIREARPRIVARQPMRGRPGREERP